MTEIFEYTDYKEFLRDALIDRKSKDPRFTHRSACAHLGLHTSNYLLLLSQGKRNLNDDMARRIADYFRLPALETEYFMWMQRFGQANVAPDKEFYWHQMLSCRVKSQTCDIQDSQYEYYSRWFNPVIRELVSIPGIKWDSRSLSKVLKPKVPAVQVRHSLALLERLGFISKQGNGWTKSAPSVATPPAVRSASVYRYHQDLITLASSALAKEPGTTRNFSSVTLDLNAEEYKTLVLMLSKFRQDALGVCGSRGDSDRVYQLNLQLFPVSRTVGKPRRRRKKTQSEAK
ncbi:MAG TPA: TIGR02147 family protein [Fibrobacteraceae bacterium]|nr:TIGR02147 family protein [Fibrobacteraceae bacterium]